MSLEEQIYCSHFKDEEMEPWETDTVTHLDNNTARYLLVPYRFLSMRAEAMRVEDIISFLSLEELNPITT